MHYTGATDIDIKTERHDQAGPHEHSSPATYYCFECSICNASIGRMYMEPPDGLECARKQFTFDLEQTTRKAFIHSLFRDPMLLVATCVRNTLI